MAAEYTQDRIYNVLAAYYGESPLTAQFGDLWSRWIAEQSLSDGFDLGAFYETATGIGNFGDAEAAYWFALGNKLAQESGDVLLLEDGFDILLEDAFTF